MLGVPGVARILEDTMSKGSREQSGRGARGAKLSSQFDRALSEAAQALDLLGGPWDDADPANGADDDGDELPLEFQLADLDRAVDSMLEARDRFLKEGRCAGTAPANGHPPAEAFQDGGRRPIHGRVAEAD